MIEHKKKLLFVHIPKCAGTFIEEYITPDINWENTTEKHLTLEDGINRYSENVVKEYFRFSIVRNPYSRLLSFFLYHKRLGTELFDASVMDRYVRKFEYEYYDSFSAFVFNIRHYSHKLEKWAVNDISPCTFFLHNHKGIELDLILKQETLSENIKKLEERIGVSFGSNVVNGAPAKYKLSDYYGSSEIELVNSLYRSDFHLFYQGMTTEQLE